MLCFIVIVLGIFLNVAAHIAWKRVSKRAEKQWRCENKAIESAIDDLLKE